MFTPLEYSTVGVTEDEAIARHGEENIEVRPLRQTILKHNTPDLRATLLIVGFVYFFPGEGPK